MIPILIILAGLVVMLLRAWWVLAHARPAPERITSFEQRDPPPVYYDMDDEDWLAAYSARLAESEEE